MYILLVLEIGLIYRSTFIPYIQILPLQVENIDFVQKGLFGEPTSLVPSSSN